jgi:uncharacterized protein YcbX
MADMATVQRLRIAPVKGLASVVRREIQLDEDGVAEDRRVLLLHADGSVVTMRRLPELVRIVPDLDLDAGTLSVTLPGGNRVSSALDTVTEPACSRLYGRDRPGRILPGDVADALSAFAGEPVRVLVADRTGVGWDEGPVSLISRASAAAVAPPDDGSGLGRFRMLIEVDGTEAFEEDRWVGHRLRIGAAVVRVAEPLQRCVVIERDPHTGVKDWAGLKSLAATRGSDRLTLGVFGSVDAPGSVRVGDDVQVLD